MFEGLRFEVQDLPGLLAQFELAGVDGLPLVERRRFGQPGQRLDRPLQRVILAL